MKCPYCDKEMSDTLNFCISCGKPIPHCQECGKPILFRTNACVQCEAVVSPVLIAGLPEMKTEEPKQLKEEQKNRKAERKTEDVRQKDVEQQIEAEQKREDKLQNGEKHREEEHQEAGRGKEESQGAEQKKQEEINKQNPTNTNSNNKNVTKKRNPLIIVMIMVLLIVIIFAILKISRTGSSHNSNAANTNSTKKDSETDTFKDDESADAQDTDNYVEEVSEESSGYGTFINILAEKYPLYAQGDSVALEMDTDIEDKSLITWYSENSAIVEVDSDGTITAIGEGETYVVASWEGIEDSCWITCEFINPSDYILPYSSERYVTKEELSDLGKDELRLARNEIYARHGRLFLDEQLQSYFNSKDWYNGYIEPDDFQESMLNDYERQNTLLITDYEKEMGYR